MQCNIPFLFFFFFFGIVFGFNQTEFRGVERGEEYAVEVGFLSGRSTSVVIAEIILNLGSAGT